MRHTLKDEEVSITLVQGMEGLESLKCVWNAIVSGMTRRHFYHLWEWHHSYLKWLEPTPGSIMYFLFKKGATPVAIFPLQSSNISLRGLKLKALAFPSHAHMPICDILCHRDALQLPLFQLLIEYLRNQGESWDVIHMPHLLEDACAITVIQGRPTAAFQLRREGGYDCIDVSETYEALELSGKFKYNLKRARQQLDRLPGVRFSFAQDGPDLEEGLKAFMDVEASGWKGSEGSGTAIKLEPSLASFYRELKEAFSVSDKAAINTLHADGKCIAAQFCLLTDDTVYMLKIGYDEAYKRYAPGKLLVDMFIRHYMENRMVKTVNFVAHREWHADWKPRTLDISALYIFNSSLAGRVGYVAMRLYGEVKNQYRAQIKPRIPKRMQEWIGKLSNDA